MKKDLTMSDWYETMENDVRWITREAKDIKELAKIAESLEKDGWEVRTASSETLTILASKKTKRIDG